jgi:hypothetical protein
MAWYCLHVSFSPYYGSTCGRHHIDVAREHCVLSVLCVSVSGTLILCCLRCCYGRALINFYDTADVACSTGSAIASANIALG